MNELQVTPQTFLSLDHDRGVGKFFFDLFARETFAGYERTSLGFLQNHSLALTDYPKVAGSYSRSIIARNVAGVEAMVARWSHGTVTSVHGHPDYALYILVTGRLGVEHFTKTGSGLQRSSTRIMEPGDHFFVEGEQGTYDNGIHRISCLEESLSLHVYSDDALKGICFIESTISSPFQSEIEKRLKAVKGLG